MHAPLAVDGSGLNLVLANLRRLAAPCGHGQVQPIGGRYKQRRSSPLGGSEFPGGSIVIGIDSLENADRALAAGNLTPDVGGALTTTQMTQAIVNGLE